VFRHLTVITLLASIASACCTSDSMCIASSTESDGVDSESETPTEASGVCCDQHGLLDGYDNICAISVAPMCVGCDGKPVLCMTTGCGVPFVEDCCLVDGRTVTCQR